MAVQIIRIILSPQQYPQHLCSKGEKPEFLYNNARNWYFQYSACSGLRY